MTNHKLDQAAMAKARQRWDGIAKPLTSLGLLEDYLVQIAGITGSSQIAIGKKAVIMASWRKGSPRPARR